jgi:hypothetical protein
MKFVYRWSEGVLASVGAISDAHLRAWEYELASDDGWPAQPQQKEMGQKAEHKDTVRLWRTRRPDLAPPELWVGEREV